MAEAMLSNDRDGWSPLELPPALLPLEKRTAEIHQQVYSKSSITLQLNIWSNSFFFFFFFFFFAFSQWMKYKIRLNQHVKY